MRAEQFAKYMLTFGRVLRKAGFAIGTGQILEAMAAVHTIGVRRRDDLYTALFAVFVTDQRQAELFRQAFELFWRAPHKLPEMMHLLLPTAEVPTAHKPHTSLRVRQALADLQPPRPRHPKLTENEEKRAVDVVMTYSPEEVLRTKDFAEFTAEEIIQARHIMARMRWPIAPVPTRRRRNMRRGPFLDARRSMRQALRMQGEFIRLYKRGRQEKQRPIVILCDISGSMERYARMLLHFLHTVAREMQRVETFVFGTRLSRTTRYLRSRDIDEAIDLVSKSVTDWGGGTRIGDALKQFNFHWARRVLRSRSVVFIVSDGWDRGDIPLLEQEIARLSRSCHRLIWLNPLLGYAAYEPLTRGMKAALPYIDDFLPVHNLDSLEQIGRLLTTLQKMPVKPAFPVG